MGALGLERPTVFGKQPELRSYEPTWRDKIASWLIGDDKDRVAQNFVGSVMGSRGLGSTGIGMVDLTPAGIPLAMNEAQRAAGEGDWAGAGLNAMAMVPGAKAGQKAIEAGVNEVRQGIRAFHGSPHDFDRFSMDKIGTGEGAQAYGHGLYFAENEGVAKSYKQDLSKGLDSVVNSYLAKHGDNIDDAIRSVEDNVKAYGMLPADHPLRKEFLADNERDLSILKTHKASGGKEFGKTYEVSINAHPDEFLDWDKPLSEQPQLVQELARKADLSHLKPGNRTRRQIEMWREGTLANPADEPSGNVLHSALTDYGTDAKSNAALTDHFRAAGIKGIRYKDAGSRDKAAGTHNYVVFDDKIIDILRKYGIAGLTAGGLGAGVAAGMAPGEAQAAPALGIPSKRQAFGR